MVVATAYGGPEVLDVIEVTPPDPGPGEVAVEVKAIGVNPADWKHYSGAWGTDPGALPLRVGHEAAGVVTAVGPWDDEGEHPFPVGAEVIVFPAPGAYAEVLTVPVSALTAKPEQMTWDKAAGLMVSGVAAVHALTVTKVGAGDTVLVHGATGGVGAMLVQLARAKGARVIGTGDPTNHEYLVDLGAVPVGYGPGLVDRVRAAAHGNLTAAIDAAGTREALDASVALIRDRRRVATLAGLGYGAQLGVKVLGSGPGADPGTEVRAKARNTLVRHVEAGRLRVRVGGVYPLSDVARAHRAGIEGRVQGKIILTPQPELGEPEPGQRRPRRLRRRDR